MTENWRPVLGYEGIYEVSDLGRARFVPKDRPVKAYMQGHYPAITLHKHGSRRVRALHILILEAFKGPRPLGLVGAHLDGSTSNAKLENLDWVTPLENEQHKVAHGTSKRGAKSHFAKFDDEQIAIIRRARELGLPAKDLAKLLRVYPQTIFDIVKGDTYPKDDHAATLVATPKSSSTPPPTPEAQTPSDDRMGWRTMADCPHDGRTVWVIGGSHEQPSQRSADGDWWRYLLKKGDQYAPTHWCPEVKPPALRILSDQNTGEVR